MYLQPSRQIGLWGLLGFVAFFWLILTVLARKPVDEPQLGKLADAHLAQLADPDWSSSFDDSWRGYIRVDQFQAAGTITLPYKNSNSRTDYVLPVSYTHLTLPTICSV